MKKYLIAIAVLFVISGCNTTDTKSLSCTNTSTANGVTTKISYDVDYLDEDIKYVTITYDYQQDNTSDKTDGVDADTDGISKNSDNNEDIDSNDVVDGVVGDTIDGIVDGVKDTILDIAGIKTSYENQLSVYDGIDGFSYKVDMDTDNRYKVIYKIDMDKIDDTDLNKFSVTRDINDFKTNYTSSGYTCK